MKGQSQDIEIPMPFRHFRWWLWFWHVVYIGVLALMLSTAVWNARAAPGWRELALTGLVAIQIALYVFIIARANAWPIARWRLALYFLGSLGIWWLEWQLHEPFFWVLMSYLGQMYGILPPRVSIPAATALYVLAFAYSLRWDFLRLTPGEAFGAFMGWLSITTVTLFINYLMRTSAERGLLIGELRAAKQELEAARQRDTELAALRERERLARDLHDSLGHALVAMSIQLEAAQRLYRVDPARASAQLDELKALSRASTDALRRSLEGLRAPGLGDRSLSKAIRDLCVETGQRIHLAIQCRIADGADALGEAVAEAFWRVTQEALTNVAKHAHARQVQVELCVDEGEATLHIADDGLGLPADAEDRPGHYGLRGMRERVEGLGGTLRVSSSGGTTIAARMPLIAEPARQTP